MKETEILQVLNATRVVLHFDAPVFCGFDEVEPCGENSRFCQTRQVKMNVSRSMTKKLAQLC